MAYDDEIRQIAQQGKPDDDTGEMEGAWLDSYHDLRAAGLDWRKAAFAAWYNAPKASRQPRTMRELAELLNYKSEQVFYKWQHQDWFRELGIDGLRQSIFNRHMADVDRATIAAALTGSHLDRKLFYEQSQRSHESAESDIEAEWWKAAELDE